MTPGRSGTAALLAALAACAALLTGCAGGGGSSATGSSSSSSNTPPPQPSNVVTVVIDAGPVDPAGTTGKPIGTLNTPFVSVTVCAHGTANCQTIDHISVDNQSTGFRVISSVVSNSLLSALTAVQDRQGRPLAECVAFADGYSWGSVKQADVKIGGEVAAGVSIEVIADPAYPTVPSACSGQGRKQEDSVTAFGANGILGVAQFKQDCGSRCVADSTANVYYACPSGSPCVATTLSLASEVSNPVALFPTDNNGTILQLPSVGASGAATVTGTLTFGIDTESNNALGTATILTADPGTGYFTVTFNNQSWPSSFIDSGSNGYFFTDSAIRQCPTQHGFYCPTSTQSLSSSVTSATGVTANVSFSVADAEALLGANPGFSVFNNLAGTNAGVPGSFDFGLPFFLGRRVITSIEGMSTSAGTQPFVAY